MPKPIAPPFRQLRHSAGLGLREVARLSGINRGRLSVIERGVMPTPDEARRIIEALTPKPDLPDDLKAEDDEA